MTTLKKILLGGLGALTPIALNLLVVDLKVLLLDLTALVVLGYIIRVVALFFLGGLVAYLHGKENNPRKIIELGIIAPAIITGLINASNVELPSTANGGDKTSVVPRSIVEPAFAKESKPKLQQVWQGLAGSFTAEKPVIKNDSGAEKNIKTAIDPRDLKIKQLERQIKTLEQQKAVQPHK